MRQINLTLIPIVSICFIFNYCLRQNESFFSSPAYLGENTPSSTAEIFVPGIISTESEEFGSSFSPNGREFYFTRKVFDPNLQREIMKIMVCRWNKNSWSMPEIASFCKNFIGGEPNFSPGGDILLFGSLLKLEDGSTDSRIMITELEKGMWNKPKNLMHGMFATMTRDSLIYYTDMSKGKGDIFNVRFSRGNIQQPVKLSEKINSPYHDAHPFISQVGDILIFDSDRPGGYGDSDLYICFRKNDEQWSEPVNMGANVNTSRYDGIPYLTPDGKYIFFSRNVDIYWIKAKMIEGLKLKELK